MRLERAPPARALARKRAERCFYLSADSTRRLKEDEGQLRGNNGHRKLLHLRLRGTEFNDGDQSNQNENDQHSSLRDREGWFGLHRSQRIESRNLHESSARRKRRR
jgi:hypothetical protein